MSEKSGCYIKSIHRDNDGVIHLRFRFTKAWGNTLGNDMNKIFTHMGKLAVLHLKETFAISWDEVKKAEFEVMRAITKEVAEMALIIRLHDPETGKLVPSKKEKSALPVHEDVTLKSFKELEAYLWQLVGHHVGSHIDRGVMSRIMKQVHMGQIARNKEHPETSLVNHRHDLASVSAFYLFAEACGAKHGKDFGFWTDDKERYSMWTLLTPQVLAASAMGNRLRTGLEILRVTIKQTAKLIPLKTSRVDKIWFREMGPSLRQESQRSREGLKALMKKVGAEHILDRHLVDFEEGLMKPERPVDTEGVTLLEDPLEPEIRSHWSSLATPEGEPEETDEKFEGLKKWIDDIAKDYDKNDN